MQPTVKYLFNFCKTNKKRKKLTCLRPDFSYAKKKKITPVNPNIVRAEPTKSRLVVLFVTNCANCSFARLEPESKIR